MGIRVLIVEDEPAAGRYLRSLIELEGPGFDIVAVADQGEAALEQVRLHGPQLVFTDVKMPLLDGIGLLRRLKDEFPQILTVIVSGYQEFDYARQALALGVSDYLLKPVNPTLLHRLLDTLAQKLDTVARQTELATVASLLAGTQPCGSSSPARLRAALIRWGGPTTRLSMLAPGSGEAPASGFWKFPGRDTRETLVLGDADRLAADAFEALARELPLGENRATLTTVFTDRSVAASDLPGAVRMLGLWLDRFLVLGRVRVHYGEVEETPVVTLDPLWVQKLRWGLGERAYHKLEALVRELVALWAGQAVPLRAVSTLVRQVLLLAHQETLGRSGDERDWEFLWEDGLSRVDTFDELADLAWNLFSGVAGLGPPTGSTDAPEAFQRIRRFVQTHYAEPLSIPLVCDRFQLSQTYLSKLFRRFEDCSFHEYLTRQRLDSAERLLADSPGLALKTVASSVGYQDPFHFSRAFKAAKGHAPSEQRKKAAKQQSQDGAE